MAETTQFIRPRVVRNRSELDKFLAARGIKSQFPSINEQLESIVISGLPDGSYNPSIIRFRGKLLMTYRFHETTLKTKLGIAELDENFKVTATQTLNLDEDESCEDARLFVFKNELWMNFVVSNWPNFPACQVKIAKLSKPDHWRISDKEQYWLPDRQTLEKNHCPLVHDEVFHVIYRQNQREENGLWQVIYSPHEKREMKTPALRWPYGEIRGGTMPLPYDGKLISFFHSRLDNEMPPTVWRYYCGCIIRKSEPPFQMLQISKRPILKGSEIGGDKTRFHFKKNIIFPLGAIQSDGGWIVSIGINDCQCSLVRISENDLQL